MRHEFTAAAQRALICASAWSNRADCDELEAETLLVGLLGEPECRAAIILSGLSVDLSAVQRRWPGLTEQPTRPAGGCIKSFSRNVELSIELAWQRLAPFIQPLELATEHLLLGLAAADHEVALWLRHNGLDPDRLEAEILKMHGCAPASGIQEYNEPENTDNGHRLSTALESSTPAIRTLDAAINRGREGLRVVEDYVRFVLDDRHLTDLCKRLRHDFTSATVQLAMQDRLSARQTEADVGTDLSTGAECERADIASVLAANFARVQESLRSIEEFGKLIDPKLAADCKRLRYRTYTLQRAVEITRGSIDRLIRAKLYVLTDGRPSAEEFRRLVHALVEAGVDMVQLRDKRLEDRELLERARILREITQQTGALCVINDRPDLALLVRADGVHLGQEDLSVKDARTVVGPHALIGVSTHSIDQARQAVLDGANYIGVGPTFPSGTKQFAHFPGVDLLRKVAGEIRLPAFAIGGISAKNLPEVLAAGFRRIAISGAVTTAADPAQAVRELKQQLNAY